MFTKLVSFIGRVLATQKNDRVDAKLDHLDCRMDALEVSQAKQTEKLNAIHQVSLANNEALEQKINLNNANSQNAKEIAEIRYLSSQEALKRLEHLIRQLLRRECNPP
jgi:hypothetical protein